MKRYALVFALSALISGFGLTACQRNERGVEAGSEAKPDRTNALTTADRDFMWKAAQSHQQEIDMGHLAQRKSTNSDVKDFADMLVKDHESALKDLNSMMDKFNAPQQGQPSKDQAMMDKLNNMESSQFEKNFLDMMVDGHQKALDTYRGELGTVQNGDLKDHVNNTIPTIEKHLNRAQQLQGQLGGAPASGKTPGKSY
jgi:putative membrane protein